MGVTARYDSNVEMTSHGESDTVYVIGPRGGMEYSGTQVDMKAGYNISANIYTRHRNFNRISQSLTLVGDISRAMNFMLPRESTLNVSDTLYSAPFFPDFETLVVPSPDVTTGGVRTPRNSSVRNVFGISESTPLTHLTKIQIGYKNAYTSYQEPTLVGSVTNGVTIGLSTVWSRIDTLSGSGSYQRFNPYGGPITHTYSLGVGETHIFSPVTTGTVNLGVGSAALPGLKKPRYIFIGGLSGSTQLTEALTLNAEIARGFSTSSGITNRVLIQDSATVSLKEHFTNYLSGRASLNASRNYSITGLGHIDIRSQRTAIGLQYQLTQWLQSSLDYSFFRQEAFEDDPYNLNRSVISLHLQAQWK